MIWLWQAQRCASCDWFVIGLCARVRYIGWFGLELVGGVVVICEGGGVCGRGFAFAVSGYVPVPRAS